MFDNLHGFSSYAHVLTCMSHELVNVHDNIFVIFNNKPRWTISTHVSDRSTLSETMQVYVSHCHGIVETHNPYN